MGWGTSFKADMYISKKIFRNKHELLDEIEEIKADIDRTKTRLKMYAIANLKDIIEDDANPLHYCQYVIDDEIEEMLSNQILLYKLELLLELSETDSNIFKNSIDDL